MLNTVLAFVRRDQLIMASYRFSFLAQVIGVIAIVIGLHFVGTVLLAGAQHTVEGMSRDYFDFLLTGLAFGDMFTIGLTAFPRTVQAGQAAGTLETMLLAHFRLPTLVIFSSAHGFLVSFFRFVIYTVMGVLVFGLWHDANLLSIACVFLLSVLVFGALGMLSTAFILVLKQGDPVMAAYGAATLVLGGLLFPVTVLPDWLQLLANFVPFTHALSGMRLALRGAPITDLFPQLGSLVAMNLVFIPAAVVTFNWALDRAKMEGSLVQY